MRYGVPYQGSKNSIATKIMSFLPPAEKFYDLFAGGCAMTHAALVSGKYKTVIANDLYDDGIELFCNAIKGKYKNEKRWISRDDFYRFKDSDVYVRLCWSFANNGRDYLYARSLEPWKRALHFARVYNDFSLFAEMGIITDGSSKDIKQHAEEYKRLYCKYIKQTIEQPNLSRLEGLERWELLQSLQILESLQRLQSLERLQRLAVSYCDVPIEPNGIVYCDPPYEGACAKGYKGEFDSTQFYQWAHEKNEPVFISSYTISDDRFTSVLELPKYNILSSTSNKLVTESLFVQKRFASEFEIPEQLTLF